MSTRNVVHRALEIFGRQAGLEKKSGAWYRRGEDVIAVSDLQKSQYGQQYYFNQGFWLRELGNDPYPTGAQCHITLRLETLVAEERDRIGQLLDLEHAMPDEERVEEVVALLEERMWPVIERGSSLAGLRAMVNDGTLASAAIRVPAREALGAVNR